MFLVALPLTAVFVGSPVVYIAAAFRVRAIKDRQRSEQCGVVFSRTADRSF